MKIEFWYIGKTNEAYITKGMEIYEKRLPHYCKFTSLCIKDVKPGQSNEETKLREADAILGKLNPSDCLILLDENGNTYSSSEFAVEVQRLQMTASQRVIFLIAGAFGAHEILQKRADKLLSLSKMTFSHQMVRLFFLEQLYRAFTILKNEKYHNP